MELTIRNYTERDAVAAGRLIADTYRQFNLSFASEQDQALFLGPFQHAWSEDKSHQAAIAAVIQSQTVLVAETAGEIAGILRGRRERLASLFVRPDYHGRGIGRKLVVKFEDESIAQGVSVIRVAATLYAIPFYLKLGYRRSTGLRTGWSFDGYGLPYQPMKKVLKPEN
jgi:GNAT superfamily N-acetyltransferase